MTTEKLSGAEGRSLPHPRGVPVPPARRRDAGPPSGSIAGIVVKVVLLGLTGALAVLAAPPLVAARAWFWLGVLVITTTLIFFVYLSRRRLAPKYFVPGMLLLVAFQVLPVIFTASMAFTNFGDAHRGSKVDAIAAIQSELGEAESWLGRVRTVRGDHGRPRNRAARLPAAGLVWGGLPRGLPWAAPARGRRVHGHRRSDHGGERLSDPDPRPGQPAQRRHHRPGRAHRDRRGPGERDHPRLRGHGGGPVLRRLVRLRHQR